MTAERESRPATNGPAQSISTAAKNSTNLTTTFANFADLDAIAAHVDGAFVVVVEKSAGRVRRRPYLTAKAAENAAQRATERGEGVRVYLAELKPLYRIVGGA